MLQIQVDLNVWARWLSVNSVYVKQQCMQYMQVATWTTAPRVLHNSASSLSLLLQHLVCAMCATKSLLLIINNLCSMKLKYCRAKKSFTRRIFYNFTTGSRCPGCKQPRLFGCNNFKIASYALEQAGTNTTFLDRPCNGHL